MMHLPVKTLLKIGPSEIGKASRRNCRVFSCDPTFAQWAAAALVDQKILRHKLRCGVFCMDKMIKNNILLVESIVRLLKEMERISIFCSDLGVVGLWPFLLQADQYSGIQNATQIVSGTWPLQSPCATSKPFESLRITFS